MKIDSHDGKANRIWVMDHSMPTKEILNAMRNSALPIDHLVGTPGGRRRNLREPLLNAPMV